LPRTVETGVIRTKIPSRLDRLPWARFHWLVILGLGTAWILDGLEVTIVGTVASRMTEIALLNTAWLPKDIGWRIGFALGVILAIAVLLVRRHVPESPRWLFIHGREAEAEAIVDDIEHGIEDETGQQLGQVNKEMTVRQRETIPFREIAWLFTGGQLNKWTFIGMVMATFFLASAGASAAYLTASRRPSRRRRRPRPNCWTTRSPPSNGCSRSGDRCPVRRSSAWSAPGTGVPASSAGPWPRRSPAAPYGGSGATPTPPNPQTDSDGAAGPCDRRAAG
jgi:Sugar (and other) transporter